LLFDTSRALNLKEYSQKKYKSVDEDKNEKLMKRIKN